MMNAIHHELDTSGMACPLPIIKTRKALNGMETGQVLQMTSTDPGSPNDMESFCQRLGHVLMSSDAQDGQYVFLIQKN